MYLKRMKDSNLNCYASVNEEDALERAAEMDRERMNDVREERRRGLCCTDLWIMSRITFARRTYTRPRVEDFERVSARF